MRLLAFCLVFASISFGSCRSSGPVGSDAEPQVQRCTDAPKSQVENQGGDRLRIESYFAEMPDATVDELSAALESGGEQLETFVRSHAGIEILSNPKLVVFDGGHGNLTQSDEVEYVQDYTVGDQGQAVPVRGTMKEGMWVDATARSVSNGSAFQLDYAIKHTAIERPIRETAVELPGSKESVTVQLPESQTYEAHSRATLPRGTSLVVRLGPAPQGDRCIVAVLGVDFEPKS